MKNICLACCKKWIVLCVVMVFLTACSNSYRQKFLGLKGQVESVKESQYTAVDRFGEVELGELNNVIIYTFNSDGKETKTARYDGTGDCLFATEYIYEQGKRTKIMFSGEYNDELGKISLIDTKDDTLIYKGTIGDKPVCIKDFQLNRYSCNITEAEYDTLKLEDWFDKNGNIIESKRIHNGDLAHWSKSKYQDGKLIQTEYLKGYGEAVVTYTYNEYDENGNWTKRTDYCNGKPEYITIRKIEYIE